MFLGEDVVETGTIYLPAGDGKTGFTLRKDMAEAGAAVLTTEGHENKEYDITNEKAYSFGEISSLLTDITGKEINYVSPSPDEFTQTLKEAGVPEESIQMSVIFASGIKEGEFSKTSTTLKELTGHSPVSVPDFLKQVYNS